MSRQAGWRPNSFAHNLWGCELGIRFPVAKLVDYRRNEQALEQSANPFATVILAQLKLVETRDAPATRWQWKIQLVKSLYDRGLRREQVRQLFRVPDWILTLPPELEQSSRMELSRFEEERRMPYVTSIERLARAEGRQEGRREGRQEGLAEGLQAGIVALLEARFKAAGARLARKVRSTHDLDRLQAIFQTVKDAETLAEAASIIRGAKPANESRKPG